MADIKTDLATGLGSSVNVDEHTYPSIEDVFYFLSSIQTPCAILIYSDSQYDDEPHRSSTFQLALFTRNFGDNPSALDDCQDLVETAITTLDHQLYENDTILVRVVSDKMIKMSKNAGPVGMIVTFKVEDY